MNGERYEVYEIVHPPAVRARFHEHVLVATCGNKEALGTVLVTLAEDRWDAGTMRAPVVAVRDAVEDRWITGPEGRV